MTKLLKDEHYALTSIPGESQAQVEGGRLADVFINAAKKQGVRINKGLISGCMGDISPAEDLPFSMA